MIKSDLNKQKILGTITRIERQLALLRKQLASDEIKPKEVNLAGLNISTRILNTLFFAGIDRTMPVSEFVRQYDRDEILKLRGMGKKKLFELQEALEEIGYDWY